MSIIDKELKISTSKNGVITDTASLYTPTDEEKDTISLVRKCFTLGDITMNKPRREFNDLSVIQRMSIDQMSWNAYQPNDGDPLAGDETNAWKSQALKPIVRNKCVSIAAHASARLIFPKIFAYSKDNQPETDGAMVMTDLMEWVADKSDYNQTSFYSIISSLINPAAIINLDYVETYKAVRGDKGSDGKRKLDFILDEENSGFKDTVVPVDELYIENIYEHDIQKQGFLIWRKVQSFELLRSKYAKKYDNFKYVKPGVQLLYNNPNQTFYEVYDTNMSQEMGEEIIFYSKALDVKLIIVNGCLLTDCDNPNPRNDKQYPFVKFGYELIDEGKFFYYKSLAFKMKQDADIINTLYPMVIDATYLSVFPPLKITGAEAINSDVIIPGAAIALSSEGADINPISVGQNIGQGIQMLQTVEDSISESSQEPLQSGQAPAGSQTAYEISKIEQNANTILGLFIKMITFYVKAYGTLRVQDILQYLTLAEASKIEGDNSLIYKTFLLPDKTINGKSKTRKITLDGTMGDEQIPGEEAMKASYKIMKLEKEGGDKMELYKVNPKLFRDLKYQLKVTPDVLQPTSDELERAYALEEYDRMIANPLANQEEAYKLLLSAYPKTKSDMEKYIAKPNPQQIPGAPAMGGGAPAPVNGGGSANLTALNA